jgi:ERCC4-related helicase
VALSPKVEPREYQRKIAETASSSNTLVVLPTGLGKTMIGAMVASRVLLREEGAKVMVLAPTRPLVLQHQRAFIEMIDLPPGEFAVLTGTVDPGERELLWRRSRLVFATPQTIYNDVRHGRISLERVGLVIFDEAHRSVRDYTYTKLARAYCDASPRPLIVGLTASPGASREKIGEIKRNLFIEKVEARSEESEDVRGYVEQTDVEPVRVGVPEEYYETRLRIRELYNDKVERLLKGGFIRGDRVTKKSLLEARTSITARLKAASASGGQKGYIYGAIVSQAQAVTILHALEVLETQGAPSLKRYLEKLRAKTDSGKSVTALLKDPRWEAVEREAEKIAAVQHPKVSVVLDVIRGQFSKDPDSRAIVFTQYRDTIEDVVGALSAGGIHARRFVGQADTGANKGMDQATQTKTLQEFRDGDFKVLVSSSIGEEGLHVPDVDLVVFYEAVPSEIRYIQRRGRTGRTGQGRVVILLAEGTVDEGYYYATLSKERRMKELVAAPPKPQARKGKPPTLMDFVD